MNDWIGYAWLKEHFQLPTTQSLKVMSQVGRDRKTREVDGIRYEIYRPASHPGESPVAHIAFALKHEGVHLELLSRLFNTIDVGAIAEWVKHEPSGQYARKAGFLYEWLTGHEIPVSGMTGNYQDVLDPQLYVASSTPEKNPRWRINDNLPGTRDYCPIVRRTDLVDLISEYDCASRLADMENDYGVGMLASSAVWLSIRESRATFAIEHEGDQKSKIHRFALAMGQYCGQFADPLAPESLTTLQLNILGPSTVNMGLRQSPVFVGSGTREMGNYIHYVAPPAKDVPGMLGGLKAFLDKTPNDNGIVRAAIASFGFVLIHPMADGNGRISRFLVNDVLRRDKDIEDPVLLPVSATIMKNDSSRNAYDRILERYSRPMMQATSADVHFGEPETYPDGIRSDFDFKGYDTLMPAWRYPDLTEQTEYLFHVVHETIEYEMRFNIVAHQAFTRTREKVKDHLDGPNEHIDRIIRSLEVNEGVISNKLKKEFPALEQDDIAGPIKQIVGEYINAKPQPERYDPEEEIEALRASLSALTMVPR